MPSGQALTLGPASSLSSAESASAASAGAPPNFDTSSDNAFNMYQGVLSLAAVMNGAKSLSTPDLYAQVRKLGGDVADPYAATSTVAALLRKKPRFRELLQQNGLYAELYRIQFPSDAGVPPAPPAAAKA